MWPGHKRALQPKQQSLALGNPHDKPRTEIVIKISQELQNNQNFVKFKFIDNGIGISEKKKKVIFEERFNKEKGSKGLGFGLTLVKKIIPDAIIEYDPDPVLSFQLRSWSMMKSDDTLVKQELEYRSLYTPEEFVNDFIKEVQEHSRFQI